MRKKIYYFPGFQEDREKKSIYDTISKLGDNFSVNKMVCIEKIGTSKISDEIKKQKNKITSGSIAIAHSMGCYFALRHSKSFSQIILLDPSLNLSDMFNKYKGNFGKSVKKIQSYETILSKLENDKKIIFITAKFGGAKIAKKYHKLAPKISTLTILNTNHNFDRKTKDRKVLASYLRNIV